MHVFAPQSVLFFRNEIKKLLFGRCTLPYPLKENVQLSKPHKQEHIQVSEWTTREGIYKGNVLVEEWHKKVFSMLAKC